MKRTIVIITDRTKRKNNVRIIRIEEYLKTHKRCTEKKLIKAIATSNPKSTVQFHTINCIK